jgi:hypothetical protein
VDAEPKTCLTCRERVPFTCSCGLTCYQRHYMDVAAGKVTWADLEAQGLVAAPLQPGPAVSRPSPLPAAETQAGRGEAPDLASGSERGSEPTWSAG